MGSEREQIDQHTEVVEFLRESNNIEGVWSQDSLNQAIKAWTYLVDEDRLSIETMLQTHKILMEGKLRSQDLGVFRKRSIRISGREGKSWYELPELTENWVWSVNEMTSSHGQSYGVPFLFLEDDISGSVYPRANARGFLETVIKKQHVDFEVIHPFVDGNGRMGRILMNWTRIKVGLPILIIREREKQQYYRWFPHG